MISLVLVITVVFCLLRMMPVEGYFSNIDKMSEADIHNALEALGLNDPLPEQLGRFFTQLAQGDLGKSIKYRQNYPIAKIVAKKAPYSIQFGLWAMAISLPLGFGHGVYCDYSGGSRGDLLPVHAAVRLQRDGLESAV